jgi:hypothetical protein
MTKTNIGTRGGLILLLLLPSLAAMANTAAVSATNYQVQGDTGDTYSSGDRVTYFYMLGATATIPLGHYLGASLAGHYGNNTLLPTPTTNALNAAHPWGECSYHSSGLDASLFTRAADIGRVGIGYGSNKLDARCDASFVATDSNTLSTKTYRTDAEYYFSSVTIAAAWARTKFESGADQTYDALTASWYPTQVTRISLTADGLDFKNTYNFAVEYQPQFLDNALGVALSITTQHETISTQTISLGLRYYFGTNVDLITRDRNYR